MSVALTMEDVTRRVLTLKAHLNVPVVWGMFWQMIILTVLVRDISNKRVQSDKPFAVINIPQCHVCMFSIIIM